MEPRFLKKRLPFTATLTTPEETEDTGGLPSFEKQNRVCGRKLPE